MKESTLDVVREMARGKYLGDDYSEYMEHVVDVLYSINYWVYRCRFPGQGGRLKHQAALLLGFWRTRAGVMYPCRWRSQPLL